MIHFLKGEEGRYSLLTPNAIFLPCYLFISAQGTLKACNYWNVAGLRDAEICFFFWVVLGTHLHWNMGRWVVVVVKGDRIHTASLLGAFSICAALCPPIQLVLPYVCPIQLPYSWLRTPLTISSGATCPATYPEFPYLCICWCSKWPSRKLQSVERVLKLISSFMQMSSPSSNFHPV